jgi:hypothetical protein
MIKNQSSVAGSSIYSFTHNTNRPGSFFAYRVRARNSFGVSEFSTQTVIGTMIVAKVVKPVVVTREGANVVVSWNSSFNDNGLPITGYDMQLKTLSSVIQYKDVSEMKSNLCDLSDPEIFS